MARKYHTAAKDMSKIVLKADESHTGDRTSPAGPPGRHVESKASLLSVLSCLLLRHPPLLAPLAILSRVPFRWGALTPDLFKWHPKFRFTYAFSLYTFLCYPVGK